MTWVAGRPPIMDPAITLFLIIRETYVQKLSLLMKILQYYNFTWLTGWGFKANPIWTMTPLAAWKNRIPLFYLRDFWLYQKLKEWQSVSVYHSGKSFSSSQFFFPYSPGGGGRGWRHGWLTQCWGSGRGCWSPPPYSPCCLTPRTCQPQSPLPQLPKIGG